MNHPDDPRHCTAVWTGEQTVSIYHSGRRIDLYLPANTDDITMSVTTTPTNQESN